MGSTGNEHVYVVVIELGVDIGRRSQMKFPGVEVVG